MSSQGLRTIFDLQREKTLPWGVYGEGDDERFRPMGRRIHAVEEVLCTLPEEQYQKWKASIAEVAWFIPRRDLWGRVNKFSDKKMIYLSPFLEFTPPSEQACVGLVVHEMAHILLDHVGSGLTHEEKEGQVECAIRKWGYGEQAEAMAKELWNFFRPDAQANNASPVS
jgi:hypothetical protein